MAVVSHFCTLIRLCSRLEDSRFTERRNWTQLTGTLLFLINVSLNKLTLIRISYLGRIGSTKLELPKWHNYSILNRVIRVQLEHISNFVHAWRIPDSQKRGIEDNWHLFTFCHASLPHKFVIWTYVGIRNFMEIRYFEDYIWITGNSVFMHGFKHKKSEKRVLRVLQNNVQTKFHSDLLIVNWHKWHSMFLGPFFVHKLNGKKRN